MERSATYFHPSKPHAGCPWFPMAWKLRGEISGSRLHGRYISEEFVVSNNRNRSWKGFYNLERPKRSFTLEIFLPFCRACSITWIPETAMWALSRRIWSRQVVWITVRTHGWKWGKGMHTYCKLYRTQGTIRHASTLGPMSHSLTCLESTKGEKVRHSYAEVPSIHTLEWNVTMERKHLKLVSAPNFPHQAAWCLLASHIFECGTWYFTTFWCIMNTIRWLNREIPKIPLSPRGLCSKCNENLLYLSWLQT